VPGKCRGGKKVLLSLGLGKKRLWRLVGVSAGYGKKRITGSYFHNELRCSRTNQSYWGSILKVSEEDAGFTGCRISLIKYLKRYGPKIKLEIIPIRDAKNYEAGLKLAQEFQERYQDTYPSLVKTLNDDLEALLAHLKLPASHRIHCRTTNLIERSFAEERRRTKVPSFLTEKSALKLVFSTLIRASRRWQRVTFTPVEIRFLDNLRERLGIVDLEEKAMRKVGWENYVAIHFYRKKRTWPI